jgi:hypothetical protein
VVAGFERNLDNAVSDFKLLWIVLSQKKIDTLADVSRVAASTFVGTNLTDELITSGLPVNQE